MIDFIQVRKASKRKEQKKDYLTNQLKYDRLITVKDKEKRT